MITEHLPNSRMLPFDAFAQGYNSRIDGLSSNCNPFKTFSPTELQQRFVWFRGWDCADQTIRIPDPVPGPCPPEQAPYDCVD